MLRDWRLGKIGRAEVCDAHPELVRAARNLGEETTQDCPICEKSKLRLVSYVYGDSLKAANGRCITNQGELDRLGEALRRVRLLRGRGLHGVQLEPPHPQLPPRPAPRRLNRLRPTPSAARWGYCVVQEMHHSSGASSVLLISPGRSGSR